MSIMVVGGIFLLLLFIGLLVAIVTFLDKKDSE